MAQVYANFIDVDYVFETTTIDSNVDATLINKLIRKSQDIDIQQTIGRDLYVKLMNIVFDGTIKSDPNNIHYYDLLCNQIRICQAYYIKLHSISEIQYHLTNKSVVTKNSEFSQVADKTDITNIENKARSDAQFYGERIIEEIYNNPGWYPEFYTVNGIKRIQAKNNNYFGGIYLPNKNQSIPSDAKISRWDGGMGGCF